MSAGSTTPVSLALASAGITAVSLTLRPVDPRGPWPLMTALTALDDVEHDGIARALGDRHGIPRIHSQALRWRGLEVTLESHHVEGGPDELLLELPSWDELADAGADGAAWDLVDRVAAAADAVVGSVGDGEAPLEVIPATAAEFRRAGVRHLALLLPAWVAADAVDAGLLDHGTLPRSGLTLLTRPLRR